MSRGYLRRSGRCGLAVLACGRCEGSDTSELKGHLHSAQCRCQTHDYEQVENAFQALALELPPPFASAVWERLPDNTRTKLSQVWFPGSHSNVGGGKADQGLADIALAWMMDQLASVGVEFDLPAVEKQFRLTDEWYPSDKNPANTPSRWWIGRSTLAYCTEALYNQTKPVRPRVLGQMTSSNHFIYRFAGRTRRTPGRYRQVDPKTNLPKETYLVDTDERVHSSVRVRLERGGLGLDDKEPYTAFDGWNVRKVGGDWQWEYSGSEAVPAKVLRETPLGRFEQQLRDMRE